jgi:hypothetical protein
MAERLKQQRRVRDEDLMVVNLCRKGETLRSAEFDSTFKVSPG